MSRGHYYLADLYFVTGNVVTVLFDVTGNEAFR